MAKEKKAEQTEKPKRRNPAIILLVIVIIATAAAFGFNYLKDEQSKVYIEKSQIVAPTIDLAPLTPGIIDRVFVSDGDQIRKNMIVAMVGDEPIRAQVDGIAINVLNEPGSIASSTNPVVEMIDPTQMRVVGSIEEDKGLSSIYVGQTAIFTVDAFGSKQYTGVVDSISPTSRTSDIVFSISDKREEQEYDIKVRYDREKYPELKNGMSARIWVYK